ncbi:MAG: DNA repair protein RecO [Gallionellaceae bacterium]|nr:DNA repair protein RecO [Gallionellaceae bacterium]
MTATDKQRIQDQPSFVLHSYPYRETSLIIEVFSRQQGRVALIARGARRPRSVLRGLLMSFQPLTLSWFGKHELRTLHKAEWQGGQPQLQGQALLCGFYVNELLLNLMIRDDPHELLFDYYQHTLQRLAHEQDHAAILRCFEKRLLQEFGYALLLEHEAGSSQPIDPAVSYRYIIERGAVRETGNGAEGLPIAGKTLHDMANDDYRDAISAQQSKQLMRMLLNHQLAGKILHTRELIKDLQKL